MKRPLTTAQIAQAFHDACLAELDALKPGNVHRFGEDTRTDAQMSVADFEASAAAAAAPLAQAGISVGTRVRRAVEATIGAVGQNTNLGIILLAAPLAAAALDDAAQDLQSRLSRVLTGLSVEDARDAYAAIRSANPGGLGAAPLHGVASEPSVTLLEAMRAAEGRDRIAWNYTHDFADIFELGLPRLKRAMARWRSPPFATTCVYLGFLAHIPDTLIERKFGHRQAVEVMQEAEILAAQLAESPSPHALVPQLVAFDRSLKSRGLNPGTSADLTVTTLFAASLQDLQEHD